MSSPHHLRALAGCNNRTPALRASSSESSASLRGSGSAEAMVKAVEGLPEDVMPVQQIEQAVYARVIAHKPRTKITPKPVTLLARIDKGIPFDPCVISAHRGGGISGGILARGHFEKGTKVASLGCCRPHEFAAHKCVLRSKLTANSRSTLATAPHRQRARRRATRAPNHRHYPSVSRRATP